MAGWLKLWRKFRESELWKEPRTFSRAEAWLYLMMEANHDNKISSGGVLVERGCLLTSRRALASVWNWDESRVRRFLNSLEADQRIARKQTNQWTSIRLTNYEQYQGVEDYCDPQVTRKPTSKRPANRPQHKKEEETTKKEEGIGASPLVQYGKHLRMTADEHAELVSVFGAALVAQEFPLMDLWIDKKESPSARQYRKPDHNHYLFARTTWLKDKSVRTGGGIATLPARQTPADRTRAALVRAIREGGES